MQGKRSWWCDGCNERCPNGVAYWLVVAVTTNTDEQKVVIDSRGKSFSGGDFCAKCMKEMAGAIERRR